LKFLIVQLPFSRHLIALRYKYSSQNPVLKHPSLCSSLSMREVNNYISIILTIYIVLPMHTPNYYCSENNQHGSHFTHNFLYSMSISRHICLIGSLLEVIPPHLYIFPSLRNDYAKIKPIHVVFCKKKLKLHIRFLSHF
jgi:hypothetical protein